MLQCGQPFKMRMFCLWRLSKHWAEMKQVSLFIWRSWDRASLMYSFKYNQQDEALYNVLYCCQCSTCFRWFFRLSSGAQKLYTQHLVYVKLPLAWVSWHCQLTHASGSSKQALHIPNAVCTVFELLMMGGETPWNMQSIDSNKEYCTTLHRVGYTWRRTKLMVGFWQCCLDA